MASRSIRGPVGSDLHARPVATVDPSESPGVAVMTTHFLGMERLARRGIDVSSIDGTLPLSDGVHPSSIRVVGRSGHGSESPTAVSELLAAQSDGFPRDVGAFRLAVEL